MTPEELSDFKLNVDLWNYPDGSLVRKAAAHIDQQAAEIERLQDREQQLKLDVDRNHNEAMTYKAAYDKQADRIKELEARCHKARRLGILLDAMTRRDLRI